MKPKQQQKQPNHKIEEVLVQKLYDKLCAHCDNFNNNFVDVAWQIQIAYQSNMPVGCGKPLALKGGALEIGRAHNKRSRAHHKHRDTNETKRIAPIE